MRRGMAIIVAGVVLAGAAAPGGPFDEEKASAFEEAKALIDEGEYRKAVRALKAYGRKYADTDEEKAEVERWIRRAEAQEEFADIDEDFRKDSRARAAALRLEKLLDDYREPDDLRDRIVEFYDGMRSQFIAVVCDFEKEDWPEKNEEASDIEPLDEPEMVRHGAQAARWKTGPGSDSFWIDPPVKDWTPYRYFCFWINVRARPEKPSVLMIQAQTDWDHYYEYTFPIDFVGWRFVRVGFADKRGFGRHGNPDWSAITRVEFYHPALVGQRIDVVIDDVRLEKHVR